MSDRLTELRRQRALVQEQLAWLDREIAALEPAARTPDTPSPAPEFAPAAPRPPAATPFVGARSAPVPPAAPAPRTSASAALAPHVTAARPDGAVPADADTILNEYRVPADTLKSDIRKGCLLYFAAAFGLLAVGVVVLYFVFRAG